MKACPALNLAFKQSAKRCPARGLRRGPQILKYMLLLWLSALQPGALFWQGPASMCDRPSETDAGPQTAMQAGVLLDRSANRACAAGRALLPQMVQPTWWLQVQASSSSGALINCSGASNCKQQACGGMPRWHHQAAGQQLQPDHKADLSTGAAASVASSGSRDPCAHRMCC